MPRGVVPIALRRRTSTKDGAGLVLPTGSEAMPQEILAAIPTLPDTPERLVLTSPPVESVARGADQPPLGQLLVQSGAAAEAVAAALAEQASSGDERQRIGELLITRGAVNERQVMQALSIQYHIPLVDLKAESPSAELAAVLPEQFSREYLLIALHVAADSLLIAIGDPTVPDIGSLVADTAGERVRLVLGTPSDIRRLHDRLFSAMAEVDQYVKAFEARSTTTEAVDRASQSERVDENAPVVQVVSRLLSQAVRDRASDVHIEPMGDRVRVRNRIDGALHEVLSLPQSMAQALVSRIKIMAGLNIVERRRPQDGQIEATVEGRELDVRVSTTGTVFGEKTVLRILDRQRALYSLEDLGMPDRIAEVYREIISSPYGMVVCAGPTGSGKTTTLYATMSTIVSDEINIMTVEDPVEYVFPAINQISINEQAGITFAGGLRSILRQDPDAILVGEIRDVETSRIAIQAALTGHFVMSTIHATDATSALHRFLDMGIESFLLASAMLAVVGQRLVRSNCTECRGPYVPSTEEMAFYERAGGMRSAEDTFTRGHGCSFCTDTGYYGRIGVYEVLRITDEMRELMVHNAHIEDMRKLGMSQGMVPMRDQAVALIDAGATTIAEVMRTVYVV